MIWKALISLRLGQRGYWNSIIVVLTMRALMILAVCVGVISTPSQSAPGWVFHLVFLWISLDLWPANALRLHDLNRSGWLAAPLLTAVAVLTWLGFVGLLNRALSGSVAPAWTVAGQFGLIVAPLASVAATVWLGLIRSDPNENRYTRWTVF